MPRAGLTTPPINTMALAVLALTFERPMHPYEMAATLKHRHKHESIKLRYGTLYTVIDRLVAEGLIAAQEVSRDGKRPERTVYRLMPAGRQRLQDWMRRLVADPVKEFPQFEAALSLLPVLPPDDAVELLRGRVAALRGEADALEALHRDLAQRSLGEMAGPDDHVPPPLLSQKFPAIFLVEIEYRLALQRAEITFVADLVRRITEEGWGPVELWRGMQAACERNLQSDRGRREMPMPEPVTRD
jgi:DNA-binding PadR family transcriptional regulator